MSASTHYILILMVYYYNCSIVYTWCEQLINIYIDYLDLHLQTLYIL